MCYVIGDFQQLFWNVRQSEVGWSRNDKVFETAALALGLLIQDDQSLFIYDSVRLPVHEHYRLDYTDAANPSPVDPRSERRRALAKAMYFWVLSRF